MADIKKDTKKEKIKWVDVISRMIALTQHGKMNWDLVDPYGTVTTERNRTSAIFQASYQGKVLRLYERKVEQQQPILEEGESFQSLLSSPIFARRYKTFWVAQVVLEFIDNKGNTLWNFPQVSALHDLLSAVQYYAAGVNEFLNSLLEEIDEES